LLLLLRLRRAVRRKPVTGLVTVATHNLEMMARLDRDMLIDEGIPAGINYAPEPLRPAYEVVVPQEFAERARQLVSPTKQP
jgi:hypothetical protein